MSAISVSEDLRESDKRYYIHLDSKYDNVLSPKMWHGPGQGPRGGPSFHGGHHGEMFGGRDWYMHEGREHDGMYMGPMGHMDPRPLNPPPMDMRRMDIPPMRGCDMDPREMRGRDPSRDFFTPENETDFSLRRQYEVSIREKLRHSSEFMGPGMGARGVPPREPNRFMDMGDRERVNYNMSWQNNPDCDRRRGVSFDRMECRDGFGATHDTPPVNMGDRGPFQMDIPQHERRMMDTDRRERPPFNPRGRFDSDTDFRNRPGSSAEFRERSPLRLGTSDVTQVDRTRSGIPSEVSVPPRQQKVDVEHSLRKQEYEDSRDSPIADYRSGEEMTLAEEWKNRCKDKNSSLSKSDIVEGNIALKMPSDFGRGIKTRDQPPFQERDQPDVSFAHRGHFADPSAGSKASQEHHLPELNPLAGPLSRENEGKRWLGESDPKREQEKLNLPERTTYLQEMNLSTGKLLEAHSGFKGQKDIPHSEVLGRSKMGAEDDFQSNSTAQLRDQDYRDIDYRTGSVTVFDYRHENFQAPEKFVKESKPVPVSKPSESGCKFPSKDQDYRNALVEDKVSNTISITGIPKNATMEQILGAFAVRDGVPMQGMKIKGVVPGYSYDSAFVEFLSLDDAVHFMESNKGSLKVGTETASMKYFQPDKQKGSVHELDRKAPQLQEPHLPTRDEPLEDLNVDLNVSKSKGPTEPFSRSQLQHSSDLTPEGWKQKLENQLEKQETEQKAGPWSSRNLSHDVPQNLQQIDPVFKDSKTMILKNVKPNITIEAVLKALDPFAYLDERNVRLVKGKTPGARGFCFVDMNSHEEVTRLVHLLTKPHPLYIDGVRVYAEVAKPLKNQKKDSKPSSSVLGYPPEASMMDQQQYFSHTPQYMQALEPQTKTAAEMQAGDLMTRRTDLPPSSSDPSVVQGAGYGEIPTRELSYKVLGAHDTMESEGRTTITEEAQDFIQGSDSPDLSKYLYDATSGFYYDPETALYYDPGSKYFYNAQTQEYLYWDAVTKTYIPAPGGNATQSVMMTPEDRAILSNPAADAPLEMKKPSDSLHNPTALGQFSTTASERKEDEESPKKDKDKDNKDEKPRSLAAVKIMKDMERWAKIQNRQKDSVRAPSPVLKTGMEQDKRQSKSADAGFAVFERKISGDDVFKKPLAPPKKDENAKRPMGSLDLLASDYGAGSDEEVEEEREEVTKSSHVIKSEEKNDRLTDWKKMACLLCRRQFPTKDALIRHQQLSDLHKQNMEIHLKIKRSKKELEALENQEKALNAKESSRSPEHKRRKPHPQHQKTWAGSSGESNKACSRPDFRTEPVTQQQPPPQKKEHVVWDHSTYKQAVRKAMFARFKELE
ncbi:RNA-binding protein 10 isoform X3 [Thalassophryne amazonica]|uniref:RNA-binding protein 10 isoform X3 n=1 Tax=Thalassophryne amazonica TaxID=390379 RepID=UPI0014719967|nr:RNA-binding protein 10 isoform X3 [Thalassophryne amazonica]